MADQREVNFFQILSFHPFLKKKRWSFKSVTVFKAINFVQYPFMILSENTSLIQNYKKIFNFPEFIIFCFKARFPLDSKWGYLTIFLGRQFSVSSVNISVVMYRHISLNMHQLSHGSEYNMANIFRVSYILPTCFTSLQASEIKPKYEKLGKYWPNCVR